MSDRPGDYERREIGYALRDHPDGEHLRMKIVGAANDTFWLSVSPVQVRAIREIVAGGDRVAEKLLAELS